MSPTRNHCPMPLAGVLALLLLALPQQQQALVQGFSAEHASSLRLKHSTASGSIQLEHSRQEGPHLEREHGPLSNCIFFKDNDVDGDITMSRPDSSLSPGLLLSVASLPLIMIIMMMTPTMAQAIDLYTVDFSHLDIPNPLPDADPRYFISGGICAAASHGITTPLDVIKTRIQSEPDVFNQGVVSAATAIVQQEGPQTLLSGLLPTILGYGFEGALKFGLYESLKPTFVNLLALDDPTEGFLAASVAAGAVASIVLCPMERTRIRLVTEPAFAGGFVGGLARLTKEEGLGSIFYGLPAMLSKQVPYTMAKQVSYDVFSGFLYALALSYSLSANKVTAEVEFFAAFLASILACAASHPGDVLLTATYKASGSNNSFGNVAASLYDEKGVNGFFSGIVARFFHVGCIITSQLILYDVIKQLLGLPATGTH